MSFWSDLLGTSKAFFRIGFAGPRLKNDAGNLAVRNANDSADVELQTSKLKNSGDSLEINSDAADTGTDRKVTFAKNPAASQSITIQVPPAKGTDGYILAQKAGTAAGIIELEWVPQSGAQSNLIAETTTLAFGNGSPVAMYTHPANAVIDKIQVVVDTAFNGTPTVSIGIAGQVSKYAAATDIDLTVATVYEIHPGLPAPGAPENIVATYAAGGASAGSARIIVYYAPQPV